MADTPSDARMDARFRDLLGDKGWLTGDETSAYVTDWTQRYRCSPVGIARPGSTDQVQGVVCLCRELGLSLTAQGGLTGLVGGGVPNESSRRGAVIVQLGRLVEAPVIDADNRTVTVSAGMVLADLHTELASHGLQFPLRIGAEGSARIGGLLATNAGGSHVLRYGMMADLVLGLSVVLADGSVWHGDRALLKDNTGYALRKLFCGAEGTLGIITRAVLRVFPAPVSRATVLLGFGSLDMAVQAASRLRRDAGDLVSALEFLTATGLTLIGRHLPDLPCPFDDPPAVVLLVEIDTSSPHIDVEQLSETMLEQLMEEGQVVDGLLAMNETQRLDFWRLREELPEAQRLAGHQLKHDVAVPVTRLVEFIGLANAAVEEREPGTVINPFGHLGDGNVHYNLSPAPGRRAFTCDEDTLSRAVYDCALQCGGTLSAEHGLGQSKVALADHYQPAAERRLMRAIKAALDPENLMNPGKILAEQ